MNRAFLFISSYILINNNIIHDKIAVVVVLEAIEADSIDDLTSAWDEAAAVSELDDPELEDDAED